MLHKFSVMRRNFDLLQPKLGYDSISPKGVRSSALLFKIPKTVQIVARRFVLPIYGLLGSSRPGFEIDSQLRVDTWSAPSCNPQKRCR